jgi:hypothetical protein
MDSKQKQHFVPEGYLRQFTSQDGGFFYCRTKKSGPKTSCRQLHVGNVCWSDRFYDLSGKYLKEYDVKFLETDFHRYENSLPTLLLKFRDHNVAMIGKDDLTLLIDAYLSIKHRTQYARKEISVLLKDEKTMSKRVDNQIQNFVIPLMNALGIPLNSIDMDEGKKRVLETLSRNENASRETHLQGLLESTKGYRETIHAAKNALFGMDLTILVAGQNEWFFTSDNPGFTLFNQNTYNTRFVNFDSVFFPINSKQTLIFKRYNGLNYINAVRPIQYILATSDNVNYVNSNTFFFSDERIFCENRDYLFKFRSSLT